MPFSPKRIITHSVVLIALFPSLAGLAAQGGAIQLDPDKAPKHGQYVYDSFGHNTRAGLSERCVDTGFWDPASATVECDPNLFASRAAPKPRAIAAAKPATASVAGSPPSQSDLSAVDEKAAVPERAPHRSAAAAAGTSSMSASTLKAAGQPAVAHVNPQSAVGKTWSESVVAAPFRADQPGGASMQEPAPARDDGILAEHRYHDGDSSAAGDDGILGASRYHDDEYPGSAHNGGTTAPSRDHDADGRGAGDDEATAHSVHGDGDANATLETLLSKPRVFSEADDGNVAAADKPQAITMLPVTITVEADPLFDFDQSAVRDDSRRKLDDLLKQLQGIAYGEVIVVGFADPIGTAIYNQSLSWRRAESVEQYLAKHGLPASRIRAEGRGETEEFVTFDSCGGIRNEHAIACLQPDRRVEVTITARRQP